MRRAASVIVPAVAFLVAACGAEQTELDNARDKWGDADVSSYRLVVTRTCYCPPDYRRSSSTVVRDGRVVSRSGDDLPGTVDALFDEAESAIDEADEAHVSYDDRYGYPKTIQVDRDKGVTDDESTLGVVRFTPLGAGP